MQTCCQEFYQAKKMYLWVAHYFLNSVFVPCATSWIWEAMVNTSLLALSAMPPRLESCSLVKYFWITQKKLGSCGKVALWVLSFELNRTYGGFHYNFFEDA